MIHYGKLEFTIEHLQMYSITIITTQETFLQDFRENLEEMFSRYYMRSYVSSRFKSLITLQCVNRR